MTTMKIYLESHVIINKIEGIIDFFNDEYIVLITNKNETITFPINNIKSYKILQGKIKFRNKLFI